MNLYDQDTVRACKRRRLVDNDNIGDFSSPNSELFPQLTCDNDLSTSISEPTEETQDEERLEIGGEELVAETVRDVCLGMVSWR